MIAGGGGWGATVGAVRLAVSVYGLGDLLSPFGRLADPRCPATSQLSNGSGQLDATLTTAVTDPLGADGLLERLTAGLGALGVAALASGVVAHSPDARAREGRPARTLS